MSPEKMTPEAELLALYRSATGMLRAEVEGRGLEALSTAELRAMLRNTVKAYEARIAYERLVLLQAQLEKLEAALGRTGMAGLGLEAPKAKESEPAPPARPAFEVIEGGKG